MERTTSAAISIRVPPLPTTLAEVVALYKQESGAVDVDTLVEIVERDAATSAYVLRRANSAYYGLKRPVSQIDRAVTILGFKPVCNVVLAVGLKQTFEQSQDPVTRPLYAHLMKTSLATGLFARDLSMHLKLRFPEATFAAGLLHQIGRLVLLFSGGRQYLSLWYGGFGDPEESDVIPHPPHITQERAVIGMDYVEVGDMIARKWNFSEEIVCAIANHLEPASVSSAHLGGLTYAVEAARHASMALYDNNQHSSFFGLSGPLAELGRRYEVPVRDLIEVLSSRRTAVREFADSILGDVA